MSSSYILSHYFSDEQKQNLAKELADSLPNEANVLGLVEILDALDKHSIGYVADKLEVVIKNAIVEDKFTESDSLIRLLSKIPSVIERILVWSSSVITKIINERWNFLYTLETSQVVKKYLLGTTTDGENTDLDLRLFIGVFDKLFQIDYISIPQEVDDVVLLLLPIQDETVSTKASKALRWRDASSSSTENLTWDLIYSLVKSKETYLVSGGLIQWLRFLIASQKSQSQSSLLQSLFQEGDYWKFIQTGLTSSTHEHRKYCLSILKLSIQLVANDISNELITFRSTESEKYVEQWKRFCTLYEIIGVDTAINQAEAARNDILQLLSPKSLIEPSWAMTLLCTGFKGSMESVRKFSLNLMYDVPGENVSIFAHKFLTDIFLRYAVEAAHFQVKKVEGVLKCDYGEKLESFLSNILKSLRKEEKKLDVTVDTLLDFLVDISAIFAPARIYVTSGLVKGLKNTQVFTKLQVCKIIKLFDSTAEDELFETYLQSLHLSLLKHIKADVPLLLDATTQFIHYNGYTLLQHSLESFLDYISIHYDKKKLNYQSRGKQYQVLYYALFGDYKVSDAFMVELAVSGFKIDERLYKDYSTLLTKLINNHGSTYEDTKHLVALKIFDNSWRSVNIELLLQSLLNDAFDQDKLEFFSNVFAKVVDVTDQQSVTLETIVQLSRNIDSLEADFKTKDRRSSFLLSILHSFLTITPLSESQFGTVFGLLQHELTKAYNHSLTEICYILQYLLKTYEDLDLITSVEILESIWEHITSERLVLNQKKMHLTFIQTIFHERLLKDTINNEFNARTLMKIGFEIVEQSKIRRSLLPCLSKQLWSYSAAYKAEFDQTLWAIELLLKILTLVQDDSNLFKAKTTLSEKYDAEVAFEKGIYQSIYGDREVSAKINVISILTSASKTFAEEYFSKLLHADPFQIIIPKKKTDGAEELQRIYAYASLLTISKTVSRSLLSQYVESSFLPILESEPSPSVRFYIEWIIAIDLIQSPGNRSSLLRLFEDHNKPTLVTSAERIAFLVSQKLGPETHKTFLEEFICYLIPNCASNKPLIRHFSNSLILSLYPELKEKKIELAIEPVLLRLWRDAKRSEVTGKYRSGDALVWDAVEDFNLTSIYGGMLSNVSPRQIEMILEEDFKEYIAVKSGISVGTYKSPKWNTPKDINAKKLDGVDSPLQTKSGAWETVLDFDEQSRQVKRSELIVVSSLVDKPPNLGGICRLCDVLGTGLMTVDDLRVTKHPQFKNVAVTADYWMPMTEVKIDGIVEFMRQKKKEGYTLIGLEQTDKSIVLGRDTEFPSKSLILLGKEAEGIPGELLAELDFCVEIRQQGVIRSMNIQTATAVIVHAYASFQADQ